MRSEHAGDIFVLAKELQKVALTIIGEKQFLKEDDHFGLMILAYAIKQFQHLESILALIETRNYRDTGLIARTMIEGTAQLRWAIEKPEVRAYRWRAFAYLVSLRGMHKQEHLGQKVDLENKRQVEEGVSKHERILLKPRYLKVRESDIPADPEKRYIKKWFIDEQGKEVKLKNIVEPILADGILRNMYEKTSKRAHWQLEDIKIERGQEEDTFIEQSSSEAWDPCAAAIFAMRDSLELFVAEFNLNYAVELEQFEAKVKKLGDSVNPN